VERDSTPLRRAIVSLLPNSIIKVCWPHHSIAVFIT
jgi:hypothetical protein